MATFEQDTFVRANTTSTSPPNWGTASNGDSWTFEGNTAYSGQISSNKGTATNNNQLMDAYLGTTQKDNVEVLCRMSDSTVTSQTLGDPAPHEHQ
jgi:hypothetical protein